MFGWGDWGFCCAVPFFLSTRMLTTVGFTFSAICVNARSIFFMKSMSGLAPAGAAEHMNNSKSIDTMKLRIIDPSFLDVSAAAFVS